MKKGGVLARMGKMAERNKKTLNSKNMEIKKKNGGKKQEVQ